MRGRGEDRGMGLRWLFPCLNRYLVRAPSPAGGSKSSVRFSVEIRKYPKRRPKSNPTLNPNPNPSSKLKLKIKTKTKLKKTKAKFRENESTLMGKMVPKKKAVMETRRIKEKLMEVE